ncbi:MAG: SRPBCC domain-containing protein [Saprospiraceae bacterium]|nr:SRPBCC domain-containing protein [Saprospiraceae bacterium]
MTNLQSDFTVDRSQNKIYIKREFAAPLEWVWNAWTHAEILDQWWAPKPWKAVTTKMNFKQGGHWLYYMLGPESEKHYARFDFLEIIPKKSFYGLDGFCDEHGQINPALPQNEWLNQFTSIGSNTLVSMTLSFKTLADLDKILQMGFKEGFSAAHQNLDDLLSQQAEV